MKNGRNVRFLSAGLLAVMVALFAGAPAYAQKAPTYEQRLEVADRPFENADAARKWAEETMRYAMNQEMLGHGYSAQTALRLTGAARITEYEADSRDALVTMGGERKNMDVFRIRARLFYESSFEDVDVLGQDLLATPIPDLESCELVWTRTKRFESVGGQLATVEKIKQNLAGKWGGYVQARLKQLLDGQTPRTDGYVDALETAWTSLRNMLDAFVSRPEAQSSVEAYDRYVVRYAQGFTGGRANATPLLKAADRLDQSVGRVLPATVGKLRSFIGLNWRNVVLKMINDKGANSAELNAEIEAFHEAFRNDRQLQPVLAQFQSAFGDRIRDTQAKELKALASVVSEYTTWVKVFAAGGSVPEPIEARVRMDCPAVLPTAQIESDAALEQFATALNGCRPYVSEAVAVERDAYMKKQRAELARRAYLQDTSAGLGSAAVIVGWDAALAEAAWGEGDKALEKGATLKAKWEAGTDSTKCGCLTGGEEVCRIFDTEDGGSYEVVARYSSNRLYEVEVCGLYPESGAPGMHRYLSSKHATKSDRGAINRFLAGQAKPGVDGALHFGGGKSTSDVYLVSSEGSYSVLYRSVSEYARRMKEERDLEAKAAKEREKSDAAKKSRGYKKDDCVMWNCDMECSRGTIFSVDNAKRVLRVTVKESVTDKREVGRRIEKQFDEVELCE